MAVPTNYSNMYSQSHMHQGSQPTVSPSLLHVPQQNTYMRSMPSASSPPTPPPTATPPPPVKQHAVLPILRELIRPQALEKSPAQAAEHVIEHLCSKGVVVECDHDTRLEVLTKLRDGANQQFFQAFSRSQRGLDVLGAWLKSALVQPEEWEDTLMPLLHVSSVN